MSCSAIQVRKWMAGELTGKERDLTTAHVAGCARCAAAMREVEQEEEALRRDVPFDAFAAGVAERLAQRPPWRLSHLAPLAAAAGLLLVAGAALVLRPSDDGGVRAKGGVSAQLFVQDAKGVRELGVEPVAPGARLRLSLHPGSHERAKAVLIEPGERTTIYEGAAVSGPLPLAFEWTGSGKATLQITFPDAPAGEMIEFTLRR
ncbi:MAG TPA: hypothetical protein VF993_07595 [Myxococcales bacterium]